MSGTGPYFHTGLVHRGRLGRDPTYARITSCQNDRDARERLDEVDVASSIEASSIEPRRSPIACRAYLLDLARGARLGDHALGDTAGAAEGRVPRG